MIKNFKTADFLLIKAEFISLDENETQYRLAKLSRSYEYL